jgi:hypothetical protein
MDTILKDPRRRNLAILAAIALVSLILAALALIHQSRENTGIYKHAALFPVLMDKMQDVARIEISSRAHGTFDVAFDPRRGWVMTQHANYPASFEQMRSTVVGLAQLETIMPKTARPEWYRFIGVDAPPNGGGTLIRLMDSKGAIIAALIMGQTTDIGDTTGAMGLYVRKPGQTQSWLARSVFEPKSDPADWMDKNILDVDRARIAETDVTPASSPPFVIKRDNPEASDFTIENMPPDREETTPGAADAIAAAITGFAFDDVRPASDLEFSGAAKLVTKTFDGLTVTVQTLPANGAIWATVYAEGATPGAEQEARAIDAHTDGWAYKLPMYKGQLFMTTLDTLLKPAAAKK